LPTARRDSPFNPPLLSRRFATVEVADHYNIKDFEVRDVEGRNVPMKELAKKVTLIVNVDCKEKGSANLECKELQELYERHKKDDFEIIAFPSGQFQIVSNQGDSVSSAQVKADLQNRFHVSFPVMDKVSVNGDDAHPLFKFLQKKLHGLAVDAIKWDFTKFLCVDGEPRTRYAPTTTPSVIEADICQVLGCESSTQATIKPTIEGDVGPYSSTGNLQGTSQNTAATSTEIPQQSTAFQSAKPMNTPSHSSTTSTTSLNASRRDYSTSTSLDLPESTAQSTLSAAFQFTSPSDTSYKNNTTAEKKGETAIPNNNPAANAAMYVEHERDSDKSKKATEQPDQLKRVDGINAKQAPSDPVHSNPDSSKE